MKSITVKDIIGTEVNVEDAILVKGMVKEALNEEIVLDFAEIHKLPTTFFANLLTDLVNLMGREYVISHLNVKNLSNEREFKRVLWGTAFCYN